MNVSCPQCRTKFNVPDAAIGARGRKMKCARCGHIWHAAPVMPVMDEVPLESPPIGQRTAAMQDDVAERLFAEHGMGDDITLSEIKELGFAGEGADSLDDDEDEEDDSFSRMSALMRARQPESMPEVYEPPPPRPPARRRGGFILWIVIFFLFLAATATVLYFLQDRLIDQWPQLAAYYDKVGLRSEQVVGFGLELQDAKSDRLSENGNEQLVIRGVVLNTTGQPRKVPLLRLALMNGSSLVQEKIISPDPPVLAGHKSEGFRFTIDQPDPTANRFQVTFVAPPAQQGK